MKKLIIATRKSPLALYQAQFVKTQLEKHYPNCRIDLLELTTEGDRTLNVSLTKIGGKGLFVKELEQALLTKRADIAVHSLKDVPMILQTELTLAAYTQREHPGDVLITRTPVTLSNITQLQSIGTSSLRRQAQLLSQHPTLTIRLLRGNIDTRLQKLKDGLYEGIILAKAGVQRLALHAPHCIDLPLEHYLPCAGQGALAIECRRHDTDIVNALRFLNDASTERAVLAERALVRALNGNCKTPIAAYAYLSDELITLRGFVGLPDGSFFVESSLTGTDPETLGQQMALDLIKKGAHSILHST